MATVIQPADAYAGLNSVVNQRLGIDILKDNTIDWVGFGTALANLDGTTSKIVTTELTTLVTEQQILPAVYKDLGVDVVVSRGTFSQAVGITQRTRPAIPDFKSDANAYNPAPGSSSDPFVNYPIDMNTNYFFKALQVMIPWSMPDRWLAGAFLSEKGFTDFLTAVRSAVDFKVRAAIDAISFSAIRGSIGLNLQGGAGNRAYYLVTEFNALMGASLTQENCLQSPDFLRYASQRIRVVMDDMSQTSTLFNEKGYPSATDFDNAHVLLLSRFQRALESNLQSDTFHKELVALPNHATVPAWKGLTAATNGGITFKTASTVLDTFDFQNTDSPKPVKIDQSGVIGHIFTKRRVSIEDLGEQTESMRDPVDLKTNYFLHLSGRVLVDNYENGVTFIAA